MNTNVVIEQAKREAKRLFKLAKQDLLDDGIPTIQIANLSQAKDVIARLNGYPGWSAFENHAYSGELSINAAEAHISLNDSSYFQYPRRELCSYTHKSSSVDIPFLLGSYRPSATKLLFKFAVPCPTYFDIRPSSAQLREHMIVIGDDAKMRGNFINNMIHTQIERNGPLFVFGLDHLDSHHMAIAIESANNKAAFHYLRFGALNEGFSSIDPFYKMELDDLVQLFSLSMNRVHGEPLWSGRFLAFVKFIFILMLEQLRLHNSYMNIDFLMECFTVIGFKKLIAQFGVQFFDRSKYVEDITTVDRNDTSTFINRIIGCLSSLPGVVIKDSNIYIVEETNNQIRHLLDAAIPVLSYLERGFKLGYFSSNPTCNISELFEHNLQVFTSFENELSSENERAWWLRLCTLHLKNLCTSSYASGKIPASDGLLIFQNFTPRMELEFGNFGVLAAQFRGLGLGCVYSTAYLQNVAILANVCTVVMFKTQDNNYINQVRGHVVFKGAQAVDDQKFNQTMNRLKSDEFWYHYKDTDVMATCPTFEKYYRSGLLRDDHPVQARFMIT